MNSRARGGKGSALASPHEERARGVALRIGLAACAVCVAWAAFDVDAFLHSYLIAWLFVVGICAGSMVNLMIHDLTGGRWGAVLRPPLEAAAGAMPVLALLALPLGFGLSRLYPWVHPDAQIAAIVEAKRWYLDPAFFIARAVVILGVWSALALLLRRDWRARRIAPASRPERRLAIVGLMVYFVTVTIAAVDWVASLVPEWSSSAIGLHLGVAQATAAFAFSVPCAAWLGREEPPRETARDRQDLGNLLLTFVMVWAYIAFTEFLIVWGEDLPHEIAWYVPRGLTSWRWVSVALLVCEFAVPAIAMLFRAVKCRVAPLAAVCLLVLAGQWLETVWLTAPSFRPAGFALHPLDIIATLALGGILIAVAIARLERAVPAPLPSREGTSHA
jgi:hypothetical protein